MFVAGKSGEIEMSEMDDDEDVKYSADEVVSLKPTVEVVPSASLPLEKGKPVAPLKEARERDLSSHCLFKVAKTTVEYTEYTSPKW